MSHFDLFADCIRTCGKIRRKCWDKHEYLQYNGEFFINQDGYYVIPQIEFKDWESVKEERKQSPMEHTLEKIKDLVK